MPVNRSHAYTAFRSLPLCLAVLLLCFARTVAYAGDWVNIPLFDKGTDVFYLEAELQGYGKSEFMLDTGSGPVALASDVLEALRHNGNAEWSHEMIAVLADGQEQRIAIYRVKLLTLAEDCQLDNIEAAELPRGARNIIGINLLKRAAPINISVAPSVLSLAGCRGEANRIAAGY